MAEIRFYHLGRGSVIRALPRLLSKGLQTGRRIVVRVDSSSVAEKLAADLWTYDPDSFLPHGTATDGHAPHQPIWITTGDENPNGATMMVNLCNLETLSFDGYDLVCDIFDGNNEAEKNMARARWSSLKDTGANLTYWQQTETGWEKKA